MKINLHNIYYYFLTCNNEVRKTHITNEFKDFKLVELINYEYRKNQIWGNRFW